MGQHITRLVDNDIYVRKAITEAQNAYRSYCKVKAAPTSSNKVELTFIIAQKYQDNARKIILEFLNYALDRSVQLNRENSI